MGSMTTFDEVFGCLKQNIIRAFTSFAHRVRPQLTTAGYLAEFDRYLAGNFRNQPDLQKSPLFLTKCLYDAYKKPVVVLVDEYEAGANVGIKYNFAEEVRPTVFKFSIPINNILHS